MMPMLMLMLILLCKKGGRREMESWNDAPSKNRGWGEEGWLSCCANKVRLVPA